MLFRSASRRSSLKAHGGFNLSLRQQFVGFVERHLVSSKKRWSIGRKSSAAPRVPSLITGCARYFSVSSFQPAIFAASRPGSPLAPRSPCGPRSPASPRSPRGPRFASSRASWRASRRTSRSRNCASRFERRSTSSSLRPKSPIFFCSSARISPNTSR